MAKLYAELTSDKGGRVASKGGDNELILSIRHGNRKFPDIRIERAENDTVRIFYVEKGYYFTLFDATLDETQEIDIK